MEWVQQGGGAENVTLSDIADDLAERGSFHHDGYDLAKSLERDGYYPDADLVEILNDFWGAKSDARRAAVKAWVIAENVRPTIEVGTVVSVDGYGGGTGPVVQVNEEEAYYLVRIDTHAGTNPSGYIGTHISYERATPTVPA